MRFTSYVSLAALSATGMLACHPAVAQSGQPVALPEVVVSTTPVPISTPYAGPASEGAGDVQPRAASESSGINVNKVPGTVSTVTAKDFEQKYSPSVADALTARVPAAIAINVDGSDLSPDLYYRGFDASRVSGTAQGLAVYQNGVRINEAFGDSVNLDLIPPIAIDRADVYTNNPIFGLNALGGAVNFTMKNGFSYHGLEASVLGGSYGRVNGSFQYGKQIDAFSMYVAADALRDSGYRPFGASNLERVYGDLGYRTQDAEVHAIGSFGRSLLGVQGVTPQVLVNQQYNSVFTTPQTTNNQAGLAQLTGRFDVAPHWTVASNFYIRQFDQYHVDGNDADVADCGDQGFAGGAGTTCLSNDGNLAGQKASAYQFLSNGKPIPYLGDGFPYGTTARTATHTTTFGTQLQATNKDTYFDHENYFVVGGSIDTSSTNFSSDTRLGQLNSAFQNIESGIPGGGAILQTRGQVGFAPVYVHSTATYYGIFALDTFNITKQLALTAGARFNIANIGLNDLSGTAPEENMSTSYNRINPVVGLTYEFTPALSIYGGYSEANRAPTPLESDCANPLRPCILETALVSDPPLQQVVSHTIEAGARGAYILPDAYGTLSYKAGYFHTTSTNDIVNEASPISGQGFFTNVPETKRAGVEASATYTKADWSFYGNYAYVDATYQFNATFSSPNNPMSDANGNIFVHPGNHIPGIPRHIGKLGAEYAFSPRFKIGADTVLVGAQYYVGDDANQNPMLPFYFVVNAHASYQLSDHVQIFGLINNLLNRKYATYGTFYGTDTTGGNINQTLFNNNPDNGGAGIAQAVTVAQPLSVYGGVKVTF